MVVTLNLHGNSLGRCILCGKRIKTGENYITSTDGYTHKSCIFGSSAPA